MIYKIHKMKLLNQIVKLVSQVIKLFKVKILKLKVLKNLNQIIVKNPNQIIVLIQKVKIVLVKILVLKKNQLKKYLLLMKNLNHKLKCNKDKRPKKKN